MIKMLVLLGKYYNIFSIVLMGNYETITIHSQINHRFMRHLRHI